MKNLYSVCFVSFLLVLSACSGQDSKEEGFESSSNEIDRVEESEGVSEENYAAYQEFVDFLGEPNVGYDEDYERIDISLGDTFEVKDKSEVTLVDVKLTDIIKPPNVGETHRYYEVENPNSLFLDIVLDVKNLRKSSEDSDDFVEVRVMYENKYEYYTNSAIEIKDGSDLSNANTKSLEPLMTGRIHYFVELPDEVKANPKNLNVIIDTETNDHYYYNYED